MFMSAALQGLVVQIHDSLDEDYQFLPYMEVSDYVRMYINCMYILQPCYNVIMWADEKSQQRQGFDKSKEMMITYVCKHNQQLNCKGNYVVYDYIT